MYARVVSLGRLRRASYPRQRHDPMCIPDL